MRKIIKIGFIILMVGALAYAGSCVYANFLVPGQNADAATIKMPKVQTAQYSFVIKATGNTVLTSSYDTYGNVYVLHGYWELVGREFKFRNRDLILDQAVFGKIEITRRVATTTQGGK